jgi:hypothetical protein
MELAGTWPGKTTLYEIQFLGKIRLELSFAEKDPTSSVNFGWCWALVVADDV